MMCGGRINKRFSSSVSSRFQISIQKCCSHVNDLSPPLKLPAAPNENAKSCCISSSAVVLFSFFLFFKVPANNPSCFLFSPFFTCLHHMDQLRRYIFYPPSFSLCLLLQLFMFFCCQLFEGLLVFCQRLNFAVRRFQPFPPLS